MFSKFPVRATPVSGSHTLVTSVLAECPAKCCSCFVAAADRSFLLYSSAEKPDKILNECKICIMALTYIELLYHASCHCRRRPRIHPRCYIVACNGTVVASSAT